ncbi:glycosyl transferase family protein [Cupriavidus basilensis OR16]|uniref:Glycosyl transferase family protein n=1 Tax=Cupriavidus basilensis OR16 TaxID=1127483 RepID=H1SF68_9BURK|nr:glycosyltransferase family 39 protein [Cupriavidus basilensis]EHP38824.1 glycosyl transferase family protein [Cupriavidus basilensis OR16]
MHPQSDSRSPAFFARRVAGLPTSLWLLAGLLILLLWFGTLDARHLLSSDEGRYAEISREMFASGDWVTIRYNALKYFEKPPFHMWVTALSYTLFGVGDWQARLCVALSGMVGLIASMFAATRWYGIRAGLLTGLVLVAAPMWSVASHFNSLDMTLSGAMACVLAFMLVAQHPEATPTARRYWMWACWVAMGVAILSKGLVGIALPGLVLVIYTLISRDFGLWRRLHLISGIVLMLIVTVPWFWLVSARNPEFPNFFFIHEHWQRYTSTVHSRGGPVWYFVPLLVAGFVPWLGLVPRIWGVIRDDGAAARVAAVRRLRPALLLAVWASAIFVFFSLSGSKLPGYIVPVFPALGMLAAVALERIDERGWRRQLNGMLVIMAIGLLASPVVATLAVLKDDMPIYGVRTLDHTLPFYLRHTTVMVEHPDELEFGTQQEPQKWLPTLESFIARWRERPPALAIMSADTYRELTTRQIPMYLVAQDQRRIVVANFALPPSPGR